MSVFSLAPHAVLSIVLFLFIYNTLFSHSDCLLSVSLDSIRIMPRSNCSAKKKTQTASHTQLPTTDAYQHQFNVVIIFDWIRLDFVVVQYVRPIFISNRKKSPFHSPRQTKQMRLFFSERCASVCVF